MKERTQRNNITPVTGAKLKGQTAVMVAMAMILLIAFVGLAVDGGSMFANRRNAQNSADAAALAGAQVMLTRYNIMVLANAYDVPGSADDDTAINTAITSYASSHGVSRSNLQAYYVNDSKQIVGSTQVGSTGSVPLGPGRERRGSQEHVAEQLVLYEDHRLEHCRSERDINCLHGDRCG